MRERLEIRCDTEDVYEPYIKTYPKFKEKWLIRETQISKFVEGYLDDPKFKEFYEYLRAKTWAVSFIKREYTPQELLGAEMLKLWISATFEPAGEEVGTKYVYPCSACEAGRYTEGPLILNLTRVPKGKDIAKTIALDEWIVSERLAGWMKQEKITGVELRPVKHYSTRTKNPPRWYQLVIKSTVEVSLKDNTYGNPFTIKTFAERLLYACGHGIEWGILSELHVKRSSWDGSDIARTNLYFGSLKKMGLLAVIPEILISQRFYRLLKEHNVKGYTIEVAHLVEDETKRGHK